MNKSIDTNKRFARLERLGLVRFETKPDDVASLDDLFGEIFDPKVNSDIPLERLEQVKQQEIDRINRYGVWGIVGSYRDTANRWNHGDSVWGFIDEDWKGSGYDDDVRRVTIDALREAIRNRCRCCHGTGVRQR